MDPVVLVAGQHGVVENDETEALMLGASEKHGEAQAVKLGLRSGLAESPALKSMVRLVPWRGCTAEKNVGSSGRSRSHQVCIRVL